MQNRIDELEQIRNSLNHLNETDSVASNHRKNRLALQGAQHCAISPQSTTLSRIISTNTDDESSPSSNTDDQNSIVFARRSIDHGNDISMPSPTEPKTPISLSQRRHSTLDRSHLTIYLPFSYSNMLQQTTNDSNCVPSGNKSTPNNSADPGNTLSEKISTTPSIEDVAQIETELNLILLLEENLDNTNPLLYSKVTINRTVEFQSLPPLESNLEKNIKKNIDT